MFDNGHSPTVPVSAPGRRRAAFVRAARREMADFRDSAHLARLVLDIRHRGKSPVRESKMEKFESFAFAIGFIATGLLTLVAQVTIV
jgi:hypothetical protein